MRELTAFITKPEEDVIFTEMREVQLLGGQIVVENMEVKISEPWEEKGFQIFKETFEIGALEALFPISSCG